MQHRIKAIAETARQDEVIEEEVGSGKILAPKGFDQRTPVSDAIQRILKTANDSVVDVRGKS